jgi:hypothetical protein
MSESLDAAKSRVADRVLGRDGVHGVGLRHAGERIVLYAGTGGASEEVVRVAREAAAPYRIVVVEEERPRLAAAANSTSAED